MYYIIFVSALLIILTAGCGSSEPAPDMEEDFSTVQAPPAVVRTVAAKQTDFPLRMFSSGTLQAAERTSISMQASGVLAALTMQEGQFVEKGALLAQLEDEALQIRLAQSQVALDEATIEKKDLLLVNRGDPEDDSSVPPEKLAAILTRSGYTRAELNVQQAELELAQTKVHAPFSGIIADVKVKPFQQITAGEEICTLINPATFEAVFKLLEREALQVRVGQPVRIRPVAMTDAEFRGKVTVINPVVSEQGLVTVRARVGGNQRRLLEGMNVEVVIEQRIPDQVVVPKSAVVLRSGRPVVFTYDAEARLAKWNYVTIAHENDEAVAIAEGVEAGDLVIHEGNLNLDHDAAVTLDSANVELIR